LFPGGLILVLVAGGIRWLSMPTRAEALEALRVPQVAYGAEDEALADLIRRHLPVSAPLDRALFVLDSLGFSRSSKFVRRPHYDVDSGGGRHRIVAQVPYRETRFFKVTNFVCDRPAIRMALRFDSAWKFESLSATSARGCI
jgi:hypothetical protein